MVEQLKKIVKFEEQQLAKKHIHVIRKPSHDMFGYVGMNKDASQPMGVPWPYKSSTIVIDKNIHGRERRRTEVHELVEKHFMNKGEPYWQAHQKAQKSEKYVK